MSSNQHAERYEEGVENSHKNDDAKDQRSIANRLDDESKNHRVENDSLSKEDKLAQEDPTAPARSHGNEPSRGAKIDAAIAEEEAEMIAKKDAKN